MPRDPENMNGIKKLSESQPGAIGISDEAEQKE